VYTNSQNHLFEQAVGFLVKKITDSGNNPKPVILHSIRVFMILYNFNYEPDIIVAALLHDLLEDSSCTPDEIAEIFGSQVIKFVSALTFDKTIADKKTRFKDEIDKAVVNGRGAALIKAADLIDNSHYYHLAEADIIPLLKYKLEYFTKTSKGLLKNEPLWVVLNQRLEIIKKTLR
jgi:(p)ppGpp synthase/HD superfamily hydrolase